jgi:hypothetical protein
VKETCFVVDHGHEGTKLYIFSDISIASIDMVPQKQIGVHHIFLVWHYVISTSM